MTTTVESHAKQHHGNSPERFMLGPRGASLMRMCGGVGILALLVALGLSWLAGDGLRRFSHAYLVSICFFASLSLGGLFFTLIMHLTRAGWGVVLRRLAEIVAAAILPVGIAFLPIVIALLVGDTNLYRWNDVDLRQTDDLIRGKAAYLNSGFFALRAVGYFVVWAILSQFFLGVSTRQDATGDKRATLRMQAISAPGMFLFALTVNFAAFDWLMSLDPHWFSTIFGVYYFAGSVVGFLALLILVARWLQGQGKLKGVTTEHFHDLGKLLFGFVFFWGYIAFSQYLLIWYANIPEETSWYLRRQENGWQWVSLLLLFGHLLVPFAGLMSRRVRRNVTLLSGWAAFVLVMHWIDLCWLVMPEYSPSHMTLGLVEILCFVGLGGLYLSSLAWLAGNRPLVPVKDPHLAESLAFKNA